MSAPVYAANTLLFAFWRCFHLIVLLFDILQILYQRLLLVWLILFQFGLIWYLFYLFSLPTPFPLLSCRFFWEHPLFANGFNHIEVFILAILASSPRRLFGTGFGVLLLLRRLLFLFIHLGGLIEMYLVSWPLWQGERVFGLDHDRIINFNLLRSIVVIGYWALIWSLSLRHTILGINCWCYEIG